MESANGMSAAPAFDVFARSFIPDSLKRINEIPATIIKCEPARWIDFPTYVASFSGTAFLLANPPPPWLEKRQGKSQHAAPSEILQPAFYHARFGDLLSQEVIALQAECEDHALYRVPITTDHRRPGPPMYVLHVPGLRELSLRIEIGDIVRLRQLNFDFAGRLIGLQTQPVATIARFPNTTMFRHDAVVWSVDRSNEILLLNISALVPGSMLFNVSFTVQEGRLGALYAAVMNTQKALDRGHQSWLRSILFPEPSDCELQRKLNRGTISWTQCDTMLNYEQVRAVDNALMGNYGRIPYIISGPPGTGKTKTIVELAVQLVSEQQASHLLLCAPSDPAADTLVQRLQQYFDPPRLLRLQAPSRSFPEVQDTILPFCYVDQDMFSLPPFQQMMRYRIVVTTCKDAEIMLRARLSNTDLSSLQQSVSSAIHPEHAVITPQLHWTALLIDEAAQAIEPEVLIPLSVVKPPEDFENTGLPLPALVMAGDQNQLGPRTASKVAALQKSLFERLQNRPVYRDHPLARSKHNRGVMRPLTQDMLPIARAPFSNLIRNYRSHPAILAVPSALFYHDTLEPDATVTDSLLGWEGWVGRQWPVLFAENLGLDGVEQDGGGWFNTAEAHMALRFAASLLRTGTLQPREICIMSPFRAQVRLLRVLSREPGYNLRSLNIGPLEAFQGLESRMVIICTTRARNRFLELDTAKGFGVIHEPRRFNIALTRAKEGLIVIGNPAVLENDVKWLEFMSFCHRNGLWQGAKWLGGERSTMQSRLERQLLHQPELEAVDLGALGSGVKQLGLSRNEEDDVWRSGLAAQDALVGEVDDSES